MNNVTSGNTIVIEDTTQSTSDSTTSTGGETVTCPAGAVGLIVAAVLRTRICYIVLGSSHASLTLTVTATGGTAQAKVILANEFQGIGSVDSGSAGGANATSISTTTAGSNEIVFESCRVFANSIAPGSGFSQLGYAFAVGDGSQDEKTLAAYQIVANASTITTACGSTNPIATGAVAALAFSVSGAPSPPLVIQLKFCSMNTVGVGNGSQNCALNNTASGNKIIVGILMASNGTSFTIGATCTETCTMPAGSQNTAVVYAGVFNVMAVGYADTSSSHTLFTVQPNKIGGSGSSDTRFMWIMEVSGINTSADTPSAAAATATTVNYTTAANNEFTVCYAGDNNANPMAPGNSFIQSGQQEATIVTIQQGLMMSKTTVSSGSNTCSYSMTSSTQPVIATLSFGLPATGSNTPAHSAIIDFNPHHYRVPWITERKKLRIETI